jgi:hypothetical protein
MGSGQQKDPSNSGGDEEADGKHQELLGLQRDIAQGQPSVYSVLWYVDRR